MDTGRPSCVRPHLTPCIKQLDSELGTADRKGGSGGVLSEYQRRIMMAALADASLDTIERTIVDQAPIDEDHKSALWLYAHALLERRRNGRLTSGLVLPTARHPGLAES